MATCLFGVSVTTLSFVAPENLLTVSFSEDDSAISEDVKRHWIQYLPLGHITSVWPPAGVHAAAHV